MKSISNSESGFDMKQKKVPLKFYLQKIRQDLLQKERPCPDEATLAFYFDEHLADSEMEQVRSHVAVCDYCIERVKQLNKGVDSHASEVAIHSETIAQDWKKFEKTIQQEIAPRKQVRRILRIAAAILLVSTFGLAAGFYFTKPAYYPLAEVDVKDELRKLDTFRGSSLLSLGVFALKESDFNSAKELLQQYVDDNSSDFNGRYHLGLTFLLKAESGLTSFFRFRRQFAHKAIEHLQVALANTEDSERRESNCHWFLGKAHLMLGEIERARSEFEKIGELLQPNPSRKRKATEILERIERLK